MTKSGANPIHGNIYHLKLLMLFLYRGITKGYSFSIGAEIPEAKSFEDLVFEYEENNKKFYRLLQAKHKLDESKKITADQLLRVPDGEYSLTKYFFAYMELKKEELFQSGSIKDVIICTNINFHMKDLQNSGIEVLEVSDTDDILDISINKGLVKKQPKRYKFNDSFAPLLMSMLDNYCLYELANKLTDFILNNKPIAPNNNVFIKYRAALAKEVIDVEKKRIKQNFIDNKNLSEDAEEFRIFFEKEIRSQSKSELSLKEINNVLLGGQTLINNKKIKLHVRRDFGKGDDSSWPANDISECSVKEFLNILTFAVHQLNEDELGIAVEEEIGCQFDNRITDNLYYKIFHNMLNCLQGKKQKGEKYAKRFYSHMDGKRLINDARKEFINFAYRICKDNLESTDFPFQKSDEVRNFITSEGSSLWLIPTETPWLISLAVYHTSQDTESNFSHHFFYWEDLLRENSRLISDFQSLDDFLLLITSLDPINTSKKFSQLVGSIQDILSGCGYSAKKLIIVASISIEFRDSINSLFANCIQKEIQIDFNAGTFEAQKKLLEKKYVLMQGNKMCISELLCRKGQRSLSIEDVNKLNLKAPDWNFIFQNLDLKVFNEVLEESTFTSANFNANLFLESEALKIAISSDSEDIFAFFGNEGEIKELVRHYKRFNKDFDIGRQRFILLDVEKEVDEFNQLCHLADGANSVTDSKKPVLHKIKALGNDKWLWIQTYSQRFYISRHFTLPFLSISTFLDCLESSDFMVFSGFEKEEFFQFLDEKSTEKFLKLEDSCFFTVSEDEANKKFYAVKEFFENRHKTDTDSQANKKGTVHFFNLFKYESGLIIQWYRFSGKTNLRSSIMIKSGYLMHEENLIELNQRLIVLAGEPGIGKSSSLHHITQILKRGKGSRIVLKIDLNVKQKLLTCRPIQSIEDFVDILCQVSLEIERNLLAQKILKYQLESFEGQVIILCDGFDEVSLEKQEEMLSVFRFILNRTKATLFITTRLQSKEILENSLGVLSYTLKVLNLTEQVDYLSLFWETSVRFLRRNPPSKRFKEIAYEVVSHFKTKYIYNKVTFLSFPLVLRLLAEKCTKVLKSVLQSDDLAFNVSEVINIKHSYEEFVYKKYDIFFFQKLRITGDLDKDTRAFLRSTFSEAFGYLAVKQMSEYPPNSISIKNENILLRALSRIGLIQTCEGLKTHFILSSLEDYFAMELVCSKLKDHSVDKPLWDFFLNKLMIRDFSRIFFNDKLEKDNELFGLISNEETRKIVYELLLEQVNSDEQVALWQAAYDNLGATFDFFLNVAEDWSQTMELLNSPAGISEYATREEIMEMGSKSCAWRKNLWLSKADFEAIGRAVRKIAEKMRIENLIF